MKIAVPINVSLADVQDVLWMGDDYFWPISGLLFLFSVVFLVFLRHLFVSACFKPRPRWNKNQYQALSAIHNGEGKD